MKKNIFVSLFMVMVSVSAYAQEQGVKSLGASVVFGSGNNISNTGYQAKFRYGLADTWRAEGSFIYFPKSDEVGLSSYDLSVNLHYCYSLSEQFIIYPLAGLGYMTWSGQTYETTYKTVYGVSVPNGIKEVDFTESKIGFNIGAGVDFQITDNIGANAEFRYRPGDGSFSRTYLSLGVFYRF